MDMEPDATGRDRLARMLAAAGLTVAAATLLRKGRRFTGALVGIGGLALGYQVAAESRESAEMPSPETPSHTGSLRCAICGDPIVPGQARGPDENDETVHVACREATAEVSD